MTEAMEFLVANGFNGQRRHWLDSVENFIKEREVRNEHIRRFGFAVLTDDVVKAIASYQPLVEVGCGSGYWSYELRKAGVEVIATDPGTGQYVWAPDGGHWQKPWLDIERISGVAAVEKYPQRNLLTIWPDFNEPWASETLQAFKGDVVLYGGEGPGGCTADDEFHSFLSDRFELAETILLPQFEHIHDDLEVWRRKD